jgi:hypothetical protein
MQRDLRAMNRPAYFDGYENLAFSRGEECVLRFHADGGPVVFAGQTHRDFPAALEQLALDRDNKALVITGTGDSFMDEIDGPSLGEIFKPAVWEKTRTEGAKVLQRLLDLPLPVVGVANGPATVPPSTCFSPTSTSPRTAPPMAMLRALRLGSPPATACTSYGRRSPAQRAPSGCCGRVSRSTRRPR